MLYVHIMYKIKLLTEKLVHIGQYYINTHTYSIMEYGSTPY